MIQLDALTDHYGNYKVSEINSVGILILFEHTCFLFVKVIGGLV